MKDKQYIIVRNEDESIKGKADLAGKVVGVQQASTGESALQNDPSGKTVKEIKSYADFVSAFMDLGIGRVDAVIADGVIARYLMTKEPGKYKIVEGTDYGVDNFAVGFRKDDTALRDKINGILAEMKKDGATALSPNDAKKKILENGNAIIKSLNSVAIKGFRDQIKAAKAKLKAGAVTTDDMTDDQKKAINADLKRCMALISGYKTYNKECIGIVKKNVSNYLTGVGAFIDAVNAAAKKEETK